MAAAAPAVRRGQAAGMVSARGRPEFGREDDAGMATPERFTGVVSDTGTRVVIVVPFNPNDVWGLKQRHHVSGSVGDCKWRGPLDHDGEQFFMALGPAWRRDNGVDVGAQVEVALSPEGPQVDNVGADVAAALEAEPEALAFFEGLPSFYRRNYIRWVESAKRPGTRAARIAEMVNLLKDGKREK